MSIKTSLGPILILTFVLAAPPSYAQAWSCNVGADNRKAESFPSWKNAVQEMRDRVTAPDFPPSQFLIITGDQDPLDDIYSIYQSVFSGQSVPFYVFVYGNHDMEYLTLGRRLVSRIPGHVTDPNSAEGFDYYFDFNNARFIVIDGHNAKYGTGGRINEAGRNWVESVLSSVPADIDHVFVFSHVPQFPRGRHWDEYLTQAQLDLRNEFWYMLLSHKDKVRTYFCGHTHGYYRMRVLDPTTPEANPMKNVWYKDLPDEEGGLLQVDLGGMGNGGKDIVTMHVKVDGQRVDFVVASAPNGAGQTYTLQKS